MQTPEVIEALLAKRDEIELSVRELERHVRRHRTQIAKIDATIRLFAPNMIMAKRQVAKFVRSVHFADGELTKRCQDALREADGGMVTTDAIVWRAMQDKGLNLKDADLRADFGRRFTWTLTAMLGRGKVRKVGSGSGAKWGLVDAE